jgi:serine/threonine-protein kinase
LPEDLPRQIGPYEVVSVLGRGGMGDVYKATDTRLGRTVALKVLRGDHARSILHEAQAIAALNHPHICTIYDVGPDYLVMEFVEGQPIRGPLPADRVRRYGVEIASALEAAHAGGLVHRDLKPANILVTPAGVKLLDFGLARRTSGAAAYATTRQATMPGTVLGTAAYMSPEQASGQPADARSDIFSLGAVLYEAASGRRAFRGETLMEMIAAVINQEPSPLEAPADLRAVIMRCLRKAPAERYQSAADVRAALDALASGASPTLRHDGASIAVLPFANLSGDKDNEYFSDGLAEEILNALARVPNLKVTARTSSFAFRGQDQDIRRIGEALDVRTVLEGSVRRAGTRIRVTAQLINAADGFRLWSERYDREVDDVFAVQDEIAGAIAGALRVTLAPAPGRYRPTMEAYEAFLRGRHFLYELGSRLPQAIQAFERAATLDPNYPDPHIEIAAVHLLRWYFGLASSRDASEIIRAEVQRAVELGNFTPRGQGLMGIIAAAYDYDWPYAERALSASLLERTGTEAEARWSYATFWLAPLGRFDEALALIQVSLRDDPLNLVWRTSIANLSSLAGRYDEAIRAARDILAIDPLQWVARFYLGECLWATGQIAEARTRLEEAHGMVPWHARTTGMLAGVCREMGDTTRADAFVSALAASPDAPGHSTGLVVHAIMTGNLDAAAEWWRHAIELRELWVTFHAASWFTRGLRASRHWPGLAEAMRLPQSERMA